MGEVLKVGVLWPVGSGLYLVLEIQRDGMSKVLRRRPRVAWLKRNSGPRIIWTRAESSPRRPKGSTPTLPHHPLSPHQDLPQPPTWGGKSSPRLPMPRVLLTIILNTVCYLVEQYDAVGPGGHIFGTTRERFICFHEMQPSQSLTMEHCTPALTEKKKTLC